MFAVNNYAQGLIFISTVQDMTKKFILFLALLIQLKSSSFYCWDNTTKYAHYYKINGSKATQDDRLANIHYLLKTKQNIPGEGVSKVAFRIESYGESGSPVGTSIIVGLITQANINQFMIIANVGSFSFQSGTTIGRICVDGRCPVDWSPNLVLRPNDIIEIEVNTRNLEAKFYLPRTGLLYKTELLEQYWKNEKIYVFFESNNIGGEVEILT